MNTGCDLSGSALAGQAPFPTTRHPLDGSRPRKVIGGLLVENCPEFLPGPLPAWHRSVPFETLETLVVLGGVGADRDAITLATGWVDLLLRLHQFAVETHGQ